jgi:hypothetical protein
VASITNTSHESHARSSLIAAALREPTAERRVKTWIGNVAAARRAIDAEAIALPPTIIDSVAMDHATNAARAISLPGGPRWEQEFLNWTIGANVGLWAGVALALGPWGFLASAAVPAYKYVRGRSVGEELAIRLGTKRNFARLGRSVPGRIDWVIPE